MEVADVTMLGEVGMVADLDPVDLPQNAWTSLSNVRCDIGGITPFGGYTIRDTLTGTPDSMQRIVSAGKNYFVIAAGEAIYSWAADVEADISLRTYSGSGAWSSCVFGGVAVFNNGIDNPQYWGGSGNCVDLPYKTSTGCTWTDVGMTAKVIKPYKNYLVAMNITDCNGNNPRRVWWSDSAAPGSVPDFDLTDETSDAGDNQLSETPGECVDGLGLHDAFILYKSDAIYQMSFRGDSAVMGFRLVTDAYGLWAEGCVCDIGGRHAFIGRNDFFIFDGANVTPVGKGRVREYFLTNVNYSAREKAFAIYKEKTNEVWFCYPHGAATDPNKALVYNVMDSTWTMRDIPISRCAILDLNYPVSGYTWSTLPYATWSDWGVDPATPAWTYWTEPVAGQAINETIVFGASSGLCYMDQGNQDNGSNVSCVAQRTNVDIGGPDDWHTIVNVWPKASGDAFSVKIGTHEEIGDAVSWSDAQTFTPGTDYKLSFRATGRLHAIEFSSTANVSWRVTGYRFSYAQAGRR